MMSYSLCMHAFPKGVMHMHKLILASGAGSSLVVTITIIVDTSAQVEPTKSTLHRNMYLVHCAVDSTASIAGGLISFDIDAFAHLHHDTCT